MLTCIILCKGFSRGSRLMQRPSRVPGFKVYRLMQRPSSIPSSRTYRLFQTPSSGAYSLQRLSAILASKDFFTVMASSGHIS